MLISHSRAMQSQSQKGKWHNLHACLSCSYQDRRIFHSAVTPTYTQFVRVPCHYTSREYCKGWRRRRGAGAAAVCWLSLKLARELPSGNSQKINLISIFLCFPSWLCLIVQVLITCKADSRDCHRGPFVYFCWEYVLNFKRSYRRYWIIHQIIICKTRQLRFKMNINLRGTDILNTFWVGFIKKHTYL